MDSGMREAENMTEIWALERRNERKTERFSVALDVWTPVGRLLELKGS